MIKYLITIFIIFLSPISSGDELTNSISEKICECGEHFKYYGQWGWCDCEKLKCDKDGNCICLKTCEQEKE